jgi:hypothetical protein
VICGSTRNLDVMHLDGNESHGDKSNLAYGCRSCNNKLAAAFKRVGKGRPTNQYNPAGSAAPTFQQYAWAVANHSRTAHDEGGAIIHATPRRLRVEYAQRIAGIKRGKADERYNPWPFSPDARQRTAASGGIAHHQAKRKPSDLNRQFLKKGSGAVTKYKGYTISRTQDGEFFSSLDPSSWYSTKAQVQKSIDSYQKGRGNPSDEERERRRIEKEAVREMIRKAKEKHGGKLGSKRGDEPFDKRKFKKGNPAAAAAEDYEDFHGHPSKEVVTVSKKVHHHAHLAAAGELRGLSVRPIGHGLPVRTIGGLRGAILAFNENKNQLFIEGGDQFLSDAELRHFGIKKPHEIETLGKVIALDYFTSKSHLGKEGGTAVYAHRLRTTNQDGKHVTVVIARYPDLIYRVMDQQLEFSGGSYEIRAEGIDK